MTGLAGSPRAAGMVGVPVGGDQMPYLEPQPPFNQSPGAFGANECTFNRLPRLSDKLTVSKISIFVGTASGNIDLGIFLSDGTTLTKIASTGSTAMSGANAVQTVNLTAPVTLRPGVDYYFAITIDNATGTVRKTDLANVWMALENRAIKLASTFPLPASTAIASTSATGWMMLAMIRP